jgi:hypothetical protein
MKEAEKNDGDMGLIECCPGGEKYFPQEQGNLLYHLLWLAYLHSCDSFSCQKASLWPGSPAFGGIARKKHRREKKSNRRSYRASAK